MPKKPLEKLPEAELDVMLALWTHTQPVRTARLLEDLADKAWSLSTLKVLLGRLADKSFVEVTREGRFTLYRARVREEDYRRMETNGLLRRYYKNSVAGMVAALVQDAVSALTPRCKYLVFVTENKVSKLADSFGGPSSVGSGFTCLLHPTGRTRYRSWRR